MSRALIVDDNAENRYLLRVLLEGDGLVVDDAADGDQALAAARRQAPDVVISDLLMPVLDGYALLREWRADARLRHVPFVVYTATYTEPRDERLAMALGADAFILKPSEPDVILDRVRELLDPGRRGPLPSAAERPLDEYRLLKDYNDVLVRKLEKKIAEIERTNRELRAEIAERERVEAALRVRDRAIQAVSQGIVITDPRQPDNPVIYASAGFERMTGYRAEEVLGRNCRFLQGEGTDAETARTLGAAIRAGRGCTVEILNYRKDGTPFWNALSVNPVHDERGELLHFVGVQQDLTERKALENQLRQSQKMEAIGHLAGGVAHDFNNLLTIICGCADILLAMPAGDGNDRELVVAIREAGDRAAALTRQLLGFSRKAILEPRVLDLNTLVTATGKMLKRLLGEDIVLKVELEPRLRRVKVDPGQLDQVLLNLAVNARDAMPTGGRLTIETANVVITPEQAATHADCRPGPHVMLAVTDTGCGMTSDVMRRIFEPFFTTKAPDRGTGLGLSMVFGIVRQSEGCIHVDSEPGRGTSFRIHLPAVDAPMTARHPALSPAQLDGTETILLIEDEAGVRVLARRILQWHGYTVLAAADGAEALKLADAHRGPLDLLLTDVVMPDLSGPRIAAQLQERFPRLKVLFMSGYTDDAVVRHGLSQTAIALIQKPYTPLGLAQKVRQVLGPALPSDVSPSKA
jgi:PAS domain S-box-containing protein